jgi:hypothetical protein
MKTNKGALVVALIVFVAGLFPGCGDPAGGKPLSQDAALGSLHIEGQELSPAFDPETLDYTVLVENSVTSLVIGATPRSADAVVSGAGAVDAPEEGGESSRELTVTAQDGVNQRTYTLVIVRLDPQGFGPAAEPPLLVPGPGEGQLTVQWNAVHGAETYELFYGTKNDLSAAQSIVLEAGTLVHVIEGIVKGLERHVWVRARKGETFKDLPPASSLVPADFASFEALAAFLEASPQNSSATPYFVAMGDLATADLNKVIDGVDVSMGALFSALRGKYATVDLRTLTGPTIPSVSVQATMDRDKLTGVVLPDSLEDLGSEVFRNCGSLVSVEFGGSLVSIGDNAFESSGLKTLELPDSLQTIGYRAFAGTSLETLELSPGLVSIKGSAFSCPTLRQVGYREGKPGAESLSIEGAFAGCTVLRSARLPDNLDSLSGGYSNLDGSFYNCPALELLSLPATTNGVRHDTALQSPNIRFETRGTGKFGTALGGRVLTQLGGTVWIAAPGLGGGEIEVPEGVIEIAESFFAWNTELRGITLPSTLTVVNNRLFQNCSALERVTIKGAISSIGDLAFYECSSLGSISLPESLRYIGYRAFARSGLRTITVPSQVESYDSPNSPDGTALTFEGCPSLEYADVRAPLLAHSMFRGCGELKEVSLAPETREIANRAFYQCAKLEKINPSEGRDINLPRGLKQYDLMPLVIVRLRGN